MNSGLFPNVLEHFIEHMGVSVTKRGVLVMDNHESHISVEVVEMAREKGLSIVAFPPICNNRKQPLDVDNEPFKRYFNTACDSWMLSHPAKTITIYDVAELNGQAFGKVLSHCNITSFKATGIYPMNRNVFPDDAFLSTAVTDR